MVDALLHLGLKLAGDAFAKLDYFPRWVPRGELRSMVDEGTATA